MSENYLRIMSGNNDRLRIMTQYITLHGKVENYRDTGVSKNGFGINSNYMSL